MTNSRSYYLGIAHDAADTLRNALRAIDLESHFLNTLIQEICAMCDDRIAEVGQPTNFKEPLLQKKEIGSAIGYINVVNNHLPQWKLLPSSVEYEMWQSQKMHFLHMKTGIRFLLYYKTEDNQWKFCHSGQRLSEIIRWILPTRKQVLIEYTKE